MLTIYFYFIYKLVSTIIKTMRLSKLGISWCSWETRYISNVLDAGCHHD